VAFRSNTEELLLATALEDGDVFEILNRRINLVELKVLSLIQHIFYFNNSSIR